MPELRTVVSVSLGFGGANAAVVLRRNGATMSPATAAVVVTGIGAVVGLCSGVGPLADALRAGVMPSSEVDRSAGYHLPESSRLAVLTDGVDLSTWVTPAAGRRMSPPSKLAVAAARMALEDAGLAEPSAGRRDAPRW